MTYFITHKPSYDVDFVELPKDLQKRATAATAELVENPATPRGNTIKPLKGYDNVWRYRIGAYRLVYSVVPDASVVQLLAIGPRGEIYERFNYEGWEDESFTVTFSRELAARLEPKKEAAPEWTEHPEWFGTGQENGEETDKAWLPRQITPEMLERLHIEREHHPALLRCRTENQLLAADAPQEAIVKVMDAIFPPTVEKIARQPDLVLFDPEDLERYAEGTLRTFLLALDEQQERYTNWALSGPTLVKGGPGSGKSTVALYRVRALVEHALEEGATGSSGKEVPDILFTTYTNALTNASESLLQQLLGDVLGLDRDEALPKSLRISTLDKTVMWIAYGSGRSFNLAEESDERQALRAARHRLKPTEMGDLDKLLLHTALQNLRDDYLLEEFKWVVEGQDCRNEADYLDAERAGRGIPFNESLRRAVWELHTAYRNYLQEQGLYSWGMLRQLALDEVRSGRFERRWDYVIVDEAQDLPPAALALCVELARSPEGIFLTADANQSLYNRGFRWKNVHEQLQVVGRTRILRRNYRSTREIAEAAADILAPIEEQDAEAVTQEYVHSGNPPAIYAANGAAPQARWLAERLWHTAKDMHLPINGAAVLVPSNKLGELLAEMLSEQGLPARFTSSRDLDLEERSVKVMTLHAAKGLEFPIVAIAHVEAGRFPWESRATDRQEVEEHEANQRRLFFVGCTRAMRHLFLTHDRGLPSPFLADLSEDRWLRLEQEGS